MSPNRNKLSRAASAAVAACLCLQSAVSGADLLVLDWSGYEDPEFHPGYIEKHGGSPDFSFFGDEEEALSKIRAGFKADVSHPCSQSVVRWRDAGVIKPLDTSRIDKWDDVLPGIRAMKDLMTTADGTAWVLPFDWGNTALTYHEERVDKSDVGSLTAFVDPKFEGRVSLPDNVDDVYALASLVIGLKQWDRMTDAQFKEASDFLREVHKNVRFYWADGPELAQGITNDEVDIAWAWNETATVMQADGVPVTMNKDTKEGLSTWVCGYVLLESGEGDEDKAYDFLNSLMEDRVADYLVTAWGYGHASETGLAGVDPQVLADTGFGDLERFVDRTLFQSPLPRELRQTMISEFEKIKAGF